MSKDYLLTIMLYFLGYTLSAQCPTGDIMLHSQAEVDAFVATYPNCTTIEGDLFIGDIFTSDIYDISGLSALTTIGGGLYVSSCPELTTLSGLDAISTIGGWLFLGSNDSLINLSNLASLTFIGGTLSIGECESLSTLSGLDALTSIGGSIYIDRNFNLTSVASLSGITSIPEHLRIGTNPSLTSLLGLDAITSVGGYLLISNNEHLESLSGLESLTSVGAFLELNSNLRLESVAALSNLDSIGGYLMLSSNNSLASLSGFSSLSSISGELKINFNDELTSLQGLEGIDPSGITTLTIRSNWALSFCAIESICAYLGIADSQVEIFNNEEGCNNRMEIEEACLDPMSGDLCPDAISIDYLMGQEVGQAQTSALLDNTNNTASDTPAEGTECFDQADDVSNSLWVSFIGDGNSYYLTTVQCNATEESYLADTQMSLYSGACDALNPLACNDNQNLNQGLLNAGLLLNTEAGVEYSLLLDGYAGAAGEFCLEVTQVAPVATTDARPIPVELFPNPTNGYVKLRSVEIEEVMIINAQGTRVASYQARSNELDLSDLPAGIYYLYLITRQGPATAKVVKVD